MQTSHAVIAAVFLISAKGAPLLVNTPMPISQNNNAMDAKLAD